MTCYSFVLFLGIFDSFFRTYATNNQANETFFSAARTGDISTLTNLIESGVDVASLDVKGNSAMIIAAGRGKVEAIKLLLAHGANIESYTTMGLFQGKTALMWASSQGRTEAVQLLIEMGASVHREIEGGVFQGKTALMWASSQGKEEVAKLLLKAGAEPDYSSSSGNFKGKRALMWASSQGRLETVKILLEAGAEVNVADNDGVTALMWAAGSERDDNDAHKKGLFEKANKGQIEVVKLLLKYGADVDLQDKDGITALMYASFHGHIDAVQAILLAGADPGFRNSEDRSALDLARSAGYTEVASVILRGPHFMELPIADVLEVSACGWLLSILRYSLFQPRNSREFFTKKDRPTITTSCTTMIGHGLDGNMKDLLYITSLSSVETIMNLLGEMNFAARMRAQDQLSILVSKYRIHVLQGEIVRNQNFNGDLDNSKQTRVGDDNLECSSSELVRMVLEKFQIIISDLQKLLPLHNEVSKTINIER